jgi:hypothetical protein
VNHFAVGGEALKDHVAPVPDLDHHVARLPVYIPGLKYTISRMKIMKHFIFYNSLGDARPYSLPKANPHTSKRLKEVFKKFL